MKKVIICLIISLLLITGCKSLTKEGSLLSEARKLEKNGNYYSAAINTMESVKIDNEYKDAIDFLKYIYPKANSDLLKKIEFSKNSEKEFKNDDVALYYKNLKTLNETSKTLPNIYDPEIKMMISLSYTDYSAELSEANEKAAEDHYQKGLYFLEKEGRENSKNAVKQFETTLAYVPGYKNSNALKEEAIEAGTQILAFLPIENRSWDLSNRQFSEMIESEIISNLMSKPEVMKYTKIVDRSLQDTLIEQQLGSLSSVMDDSSSLEIGRLLNANIVITSVINAAKIEGPYTQMKEKQRMEKIRVEEPVQGGTLENATQNLDNPYNNSDFFSNSASSNAQQYNYITKVVRAEVRIYEKKISIDTNVSYKAVDIETGTILKSDTIYVNLEDSCTWAEWNGDERALTWEDKKLINNHEQSVASSEQIATMGAKEAGKKIAAGLSEYLR